MGFLGIAFFLILSPTSSFAPIADLAFEHRMYLPLATVVTLGVFGARAAILVLVRREPARRFLLATGLAIAVVLLMGRTAVRNTLYRSPTAMWANVVSVAPHNVRAHHNYGRQLAHHRQTAEAIHHFRKIIELKPDHVDARLDLATLLAREGKPDEAIEQFRRALALNPAVAAAHYNLGILLFRQGDLDAALAHFRTAAALKPEKAVYRDMLDGMQARAGNQPEAIGSPRI